MILILAVDVDIKVTNDNQGSRIHLCKDGCWANALICRLLCEHEACSRCWCEYCYFNSLYSSPLCSQYLQLILVMIYAMQGDGGWANALICRLLYNWSLFSSLRRPRVILDFPKDSPPRAAKDKYTNTESQTQSNKHVFANAVSQTHGGPE